MAAVGGRCHEMKIGVSVTDRCVGAGARTGPHGTPPPRVRRVSFGRGTRLAAWVGLAVTSGAYVRGLSAGTGTRTFSCALVV